MNCKGRPERWDSVAWPQNVHATVRSAPGVASYGGSRAEQRHRRDILVSARASDAAGDVQTMAAPAKGRRPLRVVSGLPRRSAGVGTLAQPAFSSVSRNTFP